MNTLINQSEQEEPLFEFWNEEPVEPKPQSRLYHLEPEGIRTPFVESLTSYVLRLAAAHSVYPSRLIADEIVPLIGRSYPRSDRPGRCLSTLFDLHSSGLNGATPTARDLVQALEQLTLHRNLRFLTLLTWEQVLPVKQLLRRNSAWCPVCLEDWRTGNQTIYSPLLWAVEAVDICPQHHLRLNTQCPFPDCGKSSPPLSRHGQPGYCSHCHRWLGSPLYLIQESCSIPDERELRWHDWVATSIGELLAAAPHVSAMPSYEQVITTLASYVDELAGGNERAFTRLTQCARTRLCEWLQKKQKPQLQALLRICFYLAIPLVDFLTIPRERITSKSQGLEKQACVKQQKIQRKNFKSEQLQNLLEGVLKDRQGEPLSIKEVARRLGRHELYLYKKFPALARAITAKHRAYQTAVREEQIPCERIELSKPRKQSQEVDWESIRKTLEAILEDTESIPPSMKTVAKQLGYFDSALARKFPDLCRAISARYLEYRRRASEAKIQILCQQVRQVMLSLHKHGHYPSINQVRKQLHNFWLYRDPRVKAFWRATLTELQENNKDLINK